MKTYQQIAEAAAKWEAENAVWVADQRAAYWAAKYAGRRALAARIASRVEAYGVCICGSYGEVL